MMDEIDGIIAAVLGLNPSQLRGDLSYQSIPEWDSFRHVALMVAVEHHIGRKIDPGHFVLLASVGAIRDYVQQTSRG